MYIATYGRHTLHDYRSDDNRVILEATIDRRENECGYFDFVMPMTHPLYDEIRQHDPDGVVCVFDSRVSMDEPIFEGFVHEVEDDIDAYRSIKCKGVLAWLNDVCISESWSTISGKYELSAPSSPSDLFVWLVDYHNSHCDTFKRFRIGINQADALDDNSYILRESTQHESVGEVIKQKMTDILGGSIRVRYKDGHRVIDYLASFVESSSQVLRFGSNLTDFTRSDDATNLATCIIPKGKLEEESSGDSKDVYIDGIHDHPIDSDLYKEGRRIYSISGRAMHGNIEKVIEYDDITTDTNLLKAAARDLKNMLSPIRTIECKGIDLSLVSDIERQIKVGEYVRVVSKPHNFDSYMLCTGIKLDLNNPENSEYTLGAVATTLLGQNDKKISELNAGVNRSYEAAVSAQSFASKASIAAEEAHGRAANASEEASSALLMAKGASSAAAEASAIADEAIAEASTAKDVADLAKSDALIAKSLSDTAHNAAENAESVASAAKASAEKAESTSKVTASHFYHDAEGVHVSTLSNNHTDGSNLLLSPDEVSIRDGNTTVATFGKSIIELGKSASSAVIKFCNGLGAIRHWNNELTGANSVIIGTNSKYSPDAPNVAMMSACSVLSGDNLNDPFLPFIGVQKTGSGDSSDDLIILGASNLLIGSNGEPIPTSQAYSSLSAPYVMSRGKHGNMNWAKLSSGVSVAWSDEMKGLQFSCTGQWGSLFYGDIPSGLFRYPDSLFVEPPSETMNMRSARAWMYQYGNPSQKESAPGYLISAASYEVVDADAVSIKAIGRWK